MLLNDGHLHSNPKYCSALMSALCHGCQNEDVALIIDVWEKVYLAETITNVCITHDWCALYCVLCYRKI